MFVSYIQVNNKENKTIIYSDTVLSVKDLGNNLKISSISNIEEHQLENCLNIIFKSNSNVVFNTIQYLKNNKKLYFYANKKISTKSWEDYYVKKYRPESKSSTMLKEISNVLNSEKIKDNNCISLYDVTKLIKTKNEKHNHIKEQYINLLQNILESNCNRLIYTIIHDFDYENKELVISFNGRYGQHYEKIVFSKENGDLYIKRSESMYGNDMLVYLGNEISDLYDKLLDYSDFKQQSNYDFQSKNSNFYVSISCNNVGVYYKTLCVNSYGFQDGYIINCNSNNVINTIKGHEKEIFKQIFVNIEDCPKWSRTLLYEIRQKQLNNEHKNTKKLELKRKIFPFFKK